MAESFLIMNLSAEGDKMTQTMICYRCWTIVCLDSVGRGISQDVCCVNEMIVFVRCNDDAGDILRFV